MASKVEIEVIIAEDGQVRLDVKGIKGPACMPEVKALAEKVGRLSEQAPTGEFYEKPAQTRSQQQGGA